jgi:eukaryotic-like serine/threonine-protein kinase
VSAHDLPTKELSVPDEAGLSVVEPTDVAEPAAEEELGQGDFVGRYSVLSCLGRGGMGVVYKAYDPQLDRNVALKLLRRGRASVTADVRLLREAQTLAKLKHPNVVTVHDCGIASHGVFIAMELLSGKTVNEWLEQATRSVQEILAVFRAAGQGLLAAHEAGIVHRDFKPGNVLVEDDGSVRVLDFGLAHVLDEPPAGREARPAITAEHGSGPERPRGEPGGSSRRLRDEFATEAGLVVGTPAFMAPEQIVGSTGDHRSEQFSFAMSLYVALYARSPLAGETYQERRDSIMRGLQVTERDLERSASGEQVPLRVRRAILRGLAGDPDARFGSMAELLAELEEPPRRFRLAAVAAFTLLAGFGVGAMVFDAPGKAPCSDPEAALEGTWGPVDRAAVRAAFAAEEVASSWPRVSAQLDRYAADWVAMYQASCRATFVTRQQSGSLFDRRMRCLERRRNRLRSAIDALVSAETPQALIERSIVPFRLPELSPCADLGALDAEQPLPDDPLVRERIAALREQLDRAETLRETGDFAAGLELATSTVAGAREVDYPPLLAEALTSLGRLQNAKGSFVDAEATLREAVLQAAIAGDARTEAVAWIELLFSDALLTRTNDGVARELAARAAVERADDAVVRTWLLNNLGVLYSEHQQPELSHEYLRQAVAAKQDALGPEHVDVAVSWNNLANALLDDQHYDEARVAFEHALRIFEQTVGRAHPMFQYTRSNQCRLSHALGDANAAVTVCREVLAELEATRATSMFLARVGFTLAQAEWDAGMPELARRSAERARPHAASHPRTAERLEEWLVDPATYAAGERGDP